MLGESLISAILGTWFPGPGAIYLSQNLRFLASIRPGGILTVEGTLSAIKDHGRVIFDTVIKNQNGTQVIAGEAAVMVSVRRHMQLN